MYPTLKSCIFELKHAILLKKYLLSDQVRFFFSGRIVATMNFDGRSVVATAVTFAVCGSADRVLFGDQ